MAAWNYLPNELIRAAPTFKRRLKHILMKILTADFTDRVTTCMENLEMSGNYTDVREMSGISLKIVEMSANCQGKILSWKIV